MASVILENGLPQRKLRGKKASTKDNAKWIMRDCLERDSTAYKSDAGAKDLRLSLFIILEYRIRGLLGMTRLTILIAMFTNYDYI